MRWPSVGILQQSPATPIPSAQVWIPAQDGSGFTGTSNFQPAPPYGTTGFTDTTDCYFDVPNQIVFSGATTYLIPSGRGYLAVPTVLGAGSVTLQLQVGSNASWTTISGTTTSGYLFYEADYGNVRINGVSGATAVLYPVR